MAIPWLTLLKVVPWSDVIANAPKVADGARKLWNRAHKPVAADPAVTAPMPASGANAGAPGEQMGLLRARIDTLETAVDELHAQMRTSSELIRTLADQNAELVRHVEALQGRFRWLVRGLVGLALVVAGLVALALS